MFRNLFSGRHRQIVQFGQWCRSRILPLYEIYAIQGIEAVATYLHILYPLFRAQSKKEALKWAIAYYDKDFLTLEEALMYALLHDHTCPFSEADKVFLRLYTHDSR